MTTDRLLLCGLHDDDGAQVRDLRKLANWDEALCRQRINDMNAVEAGSPAEDLLRKLLDAEPGRRALTFRGAGMRGVLEHAFFEAIARPAAFVAEQLSPDERARRRITEAQSMVRSPLPIDTNAAGGFLITRAKVLSPGEAVTRADNVLLRDFGDRVSEELRRRGASLQQLRELKARVAKKQNVLEELRAGNVPKEKAGYLEAQYEAELEGARGALSEVQTCETGRNLRYLANLTQALYLVRNFTSHFHESDGSSLEMPLNRCHVRYVLDTCCRFFMCVQHIAADCPDIAGYLLADHGPRGTGDSDSDKRRNQRLAELEV